MRETQSLSWLCASNRLHLRKIALTTAFFVTPALPTFGQKSAGMKALSPVPAVSAAPGKSDFLWEKFQARAALSGGAFYLFEGQQPVGIATQGTDGKPIIFPIVSGATAQELVASFERFKRAKGVAAVTLLSKKPGASIASPPRPATNESGTPRAAFGTDGWHIQLAGGTTVDFLATSFEVTMPSAIPGATANRITFASTSKARTASQGPDQNGLELNGQLIGRQRKGPIWQGLKDLVFMPALYKAAQAAHMVNDTSGRPLDTPDYVALVASIEKQLGIVPIAFF